MKRVGFLVFNGVTMLDLTGPAEVLGRAPDYALTVFSPAGGNVVAANGLSISATHTPTPDDARALDTVIIAGADDLPDHFLDPALVEAASILTTGPRRIGSVCTGAFILAELGLLDDRRATTHWRHARELARRYPQVHVEADALHVHDGRYHSSAGISAGIDLALSFVEHDHGVETARAITQEMVVFLHRPGGQSQFAGPQGRTAARNPILRDVIDHVSAEPAGAHTVTSMAEHASVSTRHLGRLFRDELGTTPARWLQQFRLSTAQRLILDGCTVTAAARNSGFGSDESLRRAFDQLLHITPSEYRARFSTTFR